MQITMLPMVRQAHHGDKLVEDTSSLILSLSKDEAKISWLSQPPY